MYLKTVIPNMGTMNLFQGGAVAK